MNELPEPNPKAAPPSSDPIKWIEATRYLKNRQPFTFEGRPYLPQIYRDPAPEIYIVKGRQTEISELLVNMMMYNAGRHPGTVGLYMSSTQDKAYAFSNMRLEDWALKTSPAWRQLAPKKQSHTRQIKLVNGSTMLFRSAFNQYEEARAYPVDFLYLDEIQSQDVEYIDVAKEAMSHSRHGRIWGVGTGDYEETEWWKRWHMGVRHRWDGDAWVAEAGGDPRIHSYHIPQAIVPWITDEDIEAKFNAAQSRNQAIMEITGWWVEGVQKPITSK
ncbi:MAG: phage terminase large subunit family protein, partial [Alphaproteobacteria bacterium]|nr:phage terminase large subunit family protein [Alphaproteobacteria bacterium]